MLPIKNFSYLIVIMTILITASFFLTSKVLLLTGTKELNYAKNIHYNSIVVDAHADTLTKTLADGNWLPYMDLGQYTNFDLDIFKLQQGGVDVQFFSLWAPEKYYPGQTIGRTLALLNSLNYTIEKNPYSIALAKSIADIERLINEEKIAAVATVEGADFLKAPSGINLLHQYHDLGVKVIGLTWNHSNQLVVRESGVTDFGRKIISEMNSLGIIIDVSHLTPTSFWDVMALTEDPVIASHSGAYALKNHPRNLTDKQILAIAEKGGVIQVVFNTPFLGESRGAATVESVVDHIDYIVDLAGINHVGIGSDFDGGQMPEGLHDASMLPNITYELIKRGYSKGEIKKSLGENTLRLARRVWKTPPLTAKKNDTIISPHLPSKMGEIITDRTPLLSAVINDVPGKIFDESSFQVFLNGKIYPHQYNKTTNKLSVKLTEPLGNGFHVVTFSIKDTQHHPARLTKIFFLQ